MATVKMSALVEDVRGPMGQIIFANWKGRHYTRYKAEYINNPLTVQQTKMRVQLAASVQEWWQLTDIQRALWEEYAQGKGRARADEKTVGSKCIIKPRGILQSGFNAYVGANQIVASINQARVSVPSTQPMPPGVTIVPDNTVYCQPQVGPFPFKVALKITPAVSVYADTYARIWVKGVWAGSHGYIVKLSDGWNAGEQLEKTVFFDTIRMGSAGTIEEVPLAECMLVKLQVDLADILGETSPPAECVVAHCTAV